MSKPLEGRIALITGANRGIGLAIAREYGRAGAHCILAARNKAALEAVAGEINAAGGKAEALGMDLERPASIAAAIDLIVRRHPRLDVFVANGASLGARKRIVDYPMDVWHHTFQVNVHANLQLLQGLDALLRKSDAGRVIFLSAAVATNAKATTGSYAVTKAALEAVARIYGIEGKGGTVTINTVSPGATRTAMRAAAAPDEDPMTLKTPEDIAPLFVEMATPSYTRHDEWIAADDWLKAKKGGK
ncbi:MAG: SDR family NAD(P)-dependent oxidoreductase [Hyphomicrobium sp.]|nr:SDR family NAD(P)-dependent oxidoreductase [Hyphomicrobium sp.]